MIKMVDLRFILTKHTDEDYNDCFRTNHQEYMFVPTKEILRASKIKIPDTVHDKVPVLSYEGFRWIVYSIDHEYLHTILFEFVNIEASGMIDRINIDELEL